MEKHSKAKKYLLPNCKTIRLKMGEDRRWKDEPDLVVWIDKKTRFPCLIVRNYELGILCGYVGIDSNHKYYGKKYPDIDDLDIHGGLTFSDHEVYFLQKERRQFDLGPFIINLSWEKFKPKKTRRLPNNFNGKWFLGFDCGHAYDFIPAWIWLLPNRTFFRNDIYRDIEDVKKECTYLAKQLANE